MRLRVSLLLPILLILTLLAGASGAAAHPCHELSAQTQPVDPHALDQAGTAHPGIETGGPGICPAGHCGVDCQMQCAVAIALPVAFDIRLTLGRQIFEPAAMPANLSWRPRATQDPPRPSA